MSGASPKAPLVEPRFVRWALGLGFALLVFHAARSGPDHDEVAYLHGAWLISQGEQPYRDYMEHHHPTLDFVLAPLAPHFEGSPRAFLFAARLFNLLLLALLLAVFNRIVRPLLRDPAVTWPPLLLLGCFFFVRNSMEVRPDPWMAVLCLVGLWQWLVYLRADGRLLNAALSGLCFGAAYAVLPKALYFLGLVALGTALGLQGRPAWAKAARGALVLLVVGLVPVGALALALLRLGTFRDFLYWNYVFTPFYYWKTHFPGPSAGQMLLVSVGESPLLWLGGFWGVGIAVASLWKRKAQPAVAIAAVITLGFLFALFNTRWPYGHNTLLMQPALALLTAVVLDKVVAPRFRLALGVLLLAMVAKVGVLCFVYTENPGAALVQKRLLAETAKGTAVAVPPPYNPVFRPDAFYFWFNAEYFVPAYLEWCALHGVQPRPVEADRRVWQQHPPPFVFVPEDEPSWGPFEFAQHRAAYAPTDVPGLWQLRPAAKEAAPGGTEGR